MITIPIPSGKLAVVFKPGTLPKVDPGNPRFLLDLAGVRIRAEVSAKAARKLAVWQGSAVLQGKLVVQGGQLTLIEGGFAWTDPRPPEGQAAATTDASFSNPPKGGTPEQLA